MTFSLTKKNIFVYGWLTNKKWIVLWYDIANK